MKLVRVWQLVTLTSDDYSVPRGTLGFISEDCKHIPDAHVVSWLSHAAGSSSVPVYRNDLRDCGSFSTPVDDDQLEAVGSLSEPDDQRSECPDGGTCHHECGDGPCFRVLTCEPLSASGWGDKWPAEVALHHQNLERRSSTDRCSHGQFVIENCPWCSKSATAPAVPPSR